MSVAIYSASGKRLHCRGKHLTTEEVRAFPHRGVVRLEPGAEIARVWLLGEDACVSTMKRGPVLDTFDYLLGGVAVLLLAHYPKPIERVRSGLLYAALFGDVPAVRQAAAAKARREIAA